MPYSIPEQRSFLMAPSPSAQYESRSPGSSTTAMMKKDTQWNLLMSLSDEDDDAPSQPIVQDDDAPSQPIPQDDYAPSTPIPLHDASDADETVTPVDVEQLQATIEKLRAELWSANRKNRTMELFEAGECQCERRKATVLESERRHRNNYFVPVSKYQELEMDFEEEVGTLKERLRKLRSVSSCSIPISSSDWDSDKSGRSEGTQTEVSLQIKSADDEKDKQIAELSLMLEEAAEAYQDRDAAVEQLAAKVAELEAVMASIKTVLEKPLLKDTRNASVLESTKRENTQPSTSRPPIPLSPIRSAASRDNDETLEEHAEPVDDVLQELKQRRRFSKLVKKNRAFELRVNSSPSIRHNHDTGSLYLNPRNPPAATKALGAKPKKAVVASSAKKRRILYHSATRK